MIEQEEINNIYEAFGYDSDDSNAEYYLELDMEEGPDGPDDIE